MLNVSRCYTITFDFVLLFLEMLVKMLAKMLAYNKAYTQAFKQAFRRFKVDVIHNTPLQLYLGYVFTACLDFALKYAHQFRPSNMDIYWSKSRRACYCA